MSRCGKNLKKYNTTHTEEPVSLMNKTKCHEQAPVLNVLQDRIQAQARDKPAKRLERNCRKEIELKEMVNELKATVDGVKKKRDFYFGKLQDIEVFCHEMEEQQNVPIVQKILEILYEPETTKCQEKAAIIQAQARAIDEAKGLEWNLRKEIELKEMKTKYQKQAAIIQAQARAIDEAKGLELNLRKDLELKEMEMKQLEKTLLEWENTIKLLQEMSNSLPSFNKIRNC